MFKNYLKIFVRNLWKHVGYSISNIFGLAIGMTACFLILLFVHYELNYNDYYKNYQRTYKVQQKVLLRDKVSIDGQTGYQLASELKNKIPEIENSATVGFVYSEYLSTSDKLTFSEKYGAYADNNIFKVLTFEFLQGNPENALSSPFSVVISDEFAKKYFPGENPMGKIIKSSKNKSLRVTGVTKNLPYNLDFRPNYLVSMSTYKEVAEWKYYDLLENIGSSMFWTLVTLKSNASMQSVNEKIFNFSDRYVTNNYKKLYLKSLVDIHITSDERNDTKIAMYYISGFGIIILILACINFINLSTANSFLRKKEIGIRKVVGASRFALFMQFIGESLFFSFLAILIAAILVIVFLPTFNNVIARHIEINYARDFKFILYLIGTFLVTGFLAGVYPAIFLSGLQPSHVIKGNLSFFKKNRTGSSRSFLRKTLVTFQFYVSISLLLAAIFVIKQVNYMNTKDLGFDDKNLLICRIFGEKTEAHFETLRNELLTNPNIIDASISNNAPFYGNWGKEINWEGSGPMDKMSINYNSVSYDFINTYKIQLINGRNFSRQYSTDNKACIINETALKTLKWNDPLGKKIDNNQYTIIGVVKDFHQYSVHEIIPAYYMILNSDDLKESGVFGIRIKPNDKDKTKEYVKSQFRKFFPESIIEIVPFGNEIDFGTKGVWEIVKKLFIGFSILALLIAANGLFGMISFASQRRVKEVGIRKVFGANSSQLYTLMSKDFILMLIISAAAALPSGYLVQITTPGAYKYQMQISDYLICIGLMFLTAMAASLYHTTKAVLSNPVETLRYE